MDPKPVVFLDRDGVINALVPHPTTGAAESPHRPGDVALLPGVVEALRALAETNISVVIVSNQPGAAKGECAIEDLFAVHRRIMRDLSARGAALPDDTEYCFHHPEATVSELRSFCSCRKPLPGLLLAGFTALGRSPEDEDWMVGDSDADILAGSALGLRTISVETPESGHRRSGQVQADFTVRSLADAVRIILTAPSVSRASHS